MSTNTCKHQYLVLFKGDDSDFTGNQKILLKLETELDLAGCKAHFRFLDFKQDFNEIPADKTLELVFPKASTSNFPTGAMDAELWLEDSTGKRRTVANRIHIVVTLSVDAAYDNDDPQAITVVITSGSAEGVSWNNITGKPSTFPPSAHTHPISQVEGLQAELNQKVNKVEGATAGNLASLTSDGGIQNSGESVASLKSYTDNQVATNTANFLGTYDYATDLGFTPPATSADVDNYEISAALATHVSNPSNNDYVFVVVNYTATTPADEFRRFKYNATDEEWLYEYTLNSASFTPAQWAAINSGITGVVAPSSSATTGQAASARETGEALDGKVPVLESLTHAQLKAKRDDGTLVPGASYRITDYVATTSGDMSSQSADHPFDIIVTADAVDSLDERAHAIRHAGDTYFPNATKFEAWQVWYSIDNNTSRFAWAVADNATDSVTGTSGRGVVYRLVDEFGNDVPYDFKGIQFLAYGDNGSVYRYTFDSGDASGNTDKSLAGWPNNVFGNSIGVIFTIGKQRLNRIVFKGNYSHSNTFGCYCASNTFGYHCFHNTFGNNCYNIKFGSDCSSNTFGSNCYNIKFGTSSSTKYYCQYITIQSGNRYLYINPTGTTSASTYYQNVEIKSGVNNTSTYKTITDSNVGQTFHTTYKPANSQEISVP